MASRWAGSSNEGYYNLKLIHTLQIAISTLTVLDMYMVYFQMFLFRFSAEGWSCQVYKKQDAHADTEAGRFTTESDLFLKAENQSNYPKSKM